MKGLDIRLSPEQQAAVLTPGNLLVRAGAGSGKTEVLARRFVALTAGDIEGREPLTPAQIAAITFTEKAACDMRARIASVLDERIKASIGGEPLTRLLRARAMLPLARISTIHAFCARMLRENAIEADLDPDFVVLDDYESQTFLEHLCKQILIDKVRQKDPGVCYLAGARRLESGTPREGTLAIAMRILDEVARLGRTPQWLYEATCETAARLEKDASGVELLAKELSCRLDALLDMGVLSPAAEAKIAPLRRHHDTIRGRILAISAGVEPEALDVLRQVCECLPAAQGRIKPYVAPIKKIINVGNGRFGLDGDLILLYGACRAAPRARDIAAAMCDLAGKFEAAKADERLASFDDLLFRTRKLLEDSNDTRRRYRKILRALLVDEFQDADSIQQDVVALFATPEEHDQATELFVVGDEKQSIYRFRGADVTGFAQIQKRLGSSNIRELPLLGNRRSTPNIVAFVNGAGAKLMDSQVRPLPDYWVQWSPDHKLDALRAPKLNPAIEIVTAIPDSAPDSPKDRRGPKSPPINRDTGKLHAGSKRALEARAIAWRISQLVGTEMITDTVSGELRQSKYGDVVLLLRAFTDVGTYEAALLDAVIPCYTVKGRGFFGCQEVLDFIELLTTIDDPADSLALAATLRSPFFSICDDCLAAIALHCNRWGEDGEFAAGIPFATAFAAGAPGFDFLSTGRDDAIRAWRILSELRELRDRGTIVAVVEHALTATSYEAVMLGLRQGTQRAANLRKLVDLARDFESRRPFTFHDFVIQLRRMAEQQPYEPPAQILGENDNVVRLMTVHQAKGLEFPIVFLADTGRRPDNDTRNPVVDLHNGLLLRAAVGSGMDEIPNHLSAEFRRRNSDEQEAESVRLLYVALTRARDRLIISEGAMGLGWAKQIRTFVGEQNYAAFVNSSREQECIEVAGAQVVLMRPNCTGIVHRGGKRSEPVVNRNGAVALAQQRLEFKAPVSQDLVLSPTAIADFERCPRQYHFRHRLKLSESALLDGTSVPNASTMGEVAHAVLERLQFGASNPHQIRQITEQLGASAGLGAVDQATIAADIVRYLAEEASMAPAAREVPFFHHVGEALFVRGRIDALLQQDDHLIVQDYKYASAADHGDLYQVQMEAYALVAADAYPESSVAAEIVFLKDACITIPVQLPSLEQMRARLLLLGREIAVAQTRGNFAKRPSNRGACHRLRCGFVKRCWGG